MYRFLKRLFDTVSSWVLILLLLPIMLLISLAIKIESSGPVVFKQKRIGKNGMHFYIYKFRTMIVGAENKGTCLNSFEGDNRVTRVGAFLRKSSLDEIPQLFNILLGQMSFVGPRPPVTYSPYKFEDYPEKFKKRFEIKPGVTGLAQINGRNNLTWPEKFKYDLIYLKNASVFLDIQILFKTVLTVIKMEGSHDKKKENSTISVTDKN